MGAHHIDSWNYFKACILVRTKPLGQMCPLWHCSDPSHAVVVNNRAGKQEHPRKKENAVQPDVNGDNMKKGLQTAILHYHPVRPHVCSLLRSRTFEHDSLVTIAIESRLAYPSLLLLQCQILMYCLEMLLKRVVL